MIKTRMISSGVRAIVFNWFSIMWFTLSVATTVRANVDLKTTPNITAHCGDNVKLTCETTSTMSLDVKTFSWIGQKKQLCGIGVNHKYPEVICQGEIGSFHNTLNMTIVNITANHQGNYLCKFHAQAGMNNSGTFITVKDCLGNQHYTINESMAECWFNGSFNKGEIHWFKGANKLTETPNTTRFAGRNNYYSFTSNIKAPEKNQNYSCSLWIPERKKYVSNQSLVMVIDSPNSSGRNIQWISVLYAIVVVIVNVL
ncbi:uncharacterized protein LOC144088825 [Stigmatopora argus]